MSKSTADALAEAIMNGAPFVLISEPSPGKLHVSGPADKDWLVQALEAVLAGAQSVEDRVGTQRRVVSVIDPQQVN